MCQQIRRYEAGAAKSEWSEDHRLLALGVVGHGSIATTEQQGRLQAQASVQGRMLQNTDPPTRDCFMRPPEPPLKHRHEDCIKPSDVRLRSRKPLA